MRPPPGKPHSQTLHESGGTTERTLKMPGRMPLYSHRLSKSSSNAHFPTRAIMPPSGVLAQVATEVGDGEGDLAAFGGVDQALLHQRIAGGG